MFASYDTGGFYDEMVTPEGKPRPGCESLAKELDSFSEAELQRRQHAADLAFLTRGVTFTVYGDKAGREKIFPFDIIPRIVRAEEWAVIERGLVQRVDALNRFLGDLYGEQRIVRDGVVPAQVVESSKGFRKPCMGLKPPRGLWAHVAGIDLVRGADGRYCVLEDNIRTPSGVSYVLENREVMKRILPEVFERANVQHVSTYPAMLLETLQHLSDRRDPTVVVLTPGVHNSAYFEHSYLAQKMGLELVEGSDLLVDGQEVKMRTTRGFQRVDVIYRRIDDDFLDPQAFRPDSMLGVPGLMEAYARGNVALANAPGTGVADDKVVYPYVPEMIRYYLKEEPVLPNVPTFVCWDEEQRAHVLEHLDKLVVKAANESGGYGMLIGPHASPEEREDFAKRIEGNPRNYIAQPTLALSRAPTRAGDRLEGRHVDLRPYVLAGKTTRVLPGGLTRVALRKGSLVVNSSQGGGSKDTWVLTGAG
ncbi:MAG TPA: circularly permuted type 2 ATP-grasp protein [Candidatus Thermoplasmatota archaeon]|nr:circularly permuted type 2 ATP-grasp protein [Candidatus Thermoplasmatota archaeon]